MTIDVFERYAALDPARSPGIQPEWSTTVPVSLSIPDGREPNMQTKEQTPPQRKTPKRTRTGLLVAVTAAALVLIIGAVTLVASRSDSNTAPADAPAPPTTVQVDSEAAPAVTTADALAVSNAFFVAYNAGDVETLMGLFTSAATYGDNFSADRTGEEQEMLFEWNAAQGTTLTSQGCNVDADGQDNVVSVVCTGANHDALSQALPAPPVTYTITFDVTPDGISALRFVYGQPDFKRTGLPFLDWMRANNPADAEKADFGNWTTIEEAREYGELTARYATAWASYLTDNDCTYRDDC